MPRLGQGCSKGRAGPGREEAAPPPPAGPRLAEEGRPAAVPPSAGAPAAQSPRAMGERRGRAALQEAAGPERVRAGGALSPVGREGCGSLR